MQKNFVVDAFLSNWDVDLDDPQELRQMLQSRLNYLAARYLVSYKSPLSSAYVQPHALANCRAMCPNPPMPTTPTRSVGLTPKVIQGQF
nr:hypothetical protein [Candidatus Paracaedibacter symbiosus]